MGQTCKNMDEDHGKGRGGLVFISFDWVAGTVDTMMRFFIGWEEKSSLPEMLPRNAFRGAVALARNSG